MEFLQWIGGNAWLFDVVILFFFILSLLAGLMRGVYRSLVHTAVVFFLIILSYLVIAPLVTNWILDDLLIKYNINISISMSGMSLSLTTIRDIFIKISTLPSIVNPVSVIEASNFAYQFVMSIVMILLTVIIYIVGWLISTLIYLFFLPLQSKKKKALKAEGKKPKRHRLLGMAVSAIPTFALILVMLNAGYAFNGTILGIIGGDNMNYLTELLAALDMNFDLNNIFQFITPFLALRGGEGGMFLTPLAFGGNLFSMDFILGGLQGFQPNAPIASISSDYFTRIYSGIDGLLNMIPSDPSGGGEVVEILTMGL